MECTIQGGINMESIIQIKGAVNFAITLDPTVWIFDDRKLDLDTYFTEERVIVNADEEYMEKAGKHWSREIMEGATFPPTLKSERKFEKKHMMTGTFGIILRPFLNNAEIKDGATTVILECRDGSEYNFSIEDAESLILKYSQDGKMLTDNGPVYVLNGDGSNVENPIKGLVAIRVE